MNSPTPFRRANPQKSSPSCGAPTRAARAARDLRDLLASDLPPTPEQRLELAAVLVGSEADAAAA